jgi:hypothetical protein
MPATCLTYEAITLRLCNPFRLSYGVSETRRGFWLRLKDVAASEGPAANSRARGGLDAGDVGWGEGTIPSYYQIPEAKMCAFWDAMARRRDPFAADPDGIAAWVGADGPAPARSALDLALHDRLARRSPASGRKRRLDG